MTRIHAPSAPTPSERANIPRYRDDDRFHEIWFVVVMEPQSRRAHWLRYTIYAGAGGSRATLWAATFDGDRPPVAEKKILPLDAFDRGPDDRFAIRIGEATMDQGTLRGRVDRIAWDLSFVPNESPAVRMPRLAERLPLPAHAIHANADVPFSGTITVDGAVRAIAPGARGAQMHIWGRRRVEELSWIYDPHAAVEVVSARPFARAPFPRSTSVWLGSVDITQPPAALRARTSSPGPGVLDVRSQSARHFVRVRAWCALPSLVGYVYRDPSGRDLHVAQSDVASCWVEIYRRRRGVVRLIPERVVTTRGTSALELHGAASLDGVDYIGWDDEKRKATSRDEGPAPTNASIPRIPRGGRIVALGLTYRDHVEETSSASELVAFEKDARSLLAEGDSVPMPSSDAILAALESVEAGLAARLRERFAFVPAMLDYEAELAMVVLDDGRIGWAVANDLTARSCQVLGEGAPDPMTFWGVAKSFPGFLPIGPVWIAPEEGVPDVVLTTRVNGEIRQRASTRDLLYKRDEMLARARSLLGRDLVAGDIVLTGTPSGIAFRVSRLKRMLGRRLLDRFGRLSASISAYATNDAFLRPGDVVEVDAEKVGSRRVVIAGAAGQEST